MQVHTHAYISMRVHTRTISTDKNMYTTQNNMRTQSTRFSAESHTIPQLHHRCATQKYGCDVMSLLVFRGQNLSDTPAHNFLRAITFGITVGS